MGWGKMDKKEIERRLLIFISEIDIEDIKTISLMTKLMKIFLIGV